MRRAWIVLGAMVALGCEAEPAPGEWGAMRYFGEVPGTAPLRLFPPVSDRADNVYVLHGSPARNEALALVGHAGGGWSEGCKLHKGSTRGAHGFVGTSDDRAWYWSGDALVEVNGATGACQLVLDRDPTSQVDLRFRGVIPWVQDTPSQTLVPAIVGAVSDPVPYQVLVDLDVGRYESAGRLEPVDGTNWRIAGVGADPAAGEGFYVVTYDQGGRTHVEGRFVDERGRVTDRVAFDGTGPLAEDAVVGRLMGSGGLVAGLLEDGRLLLFTRSWARIEPVVGLLPRGVHRWGGTLYVVGLAGARPHVAALSPEGALGDLMLWKSSERANEALSGPVRVRDERQDGSPPTEWTDAQTAMGEFPFLSPHSPFRYTTATTLWLIAGPSYNTGVEGMTAVALAPAGLSYP